MICECVCVCVREREREIERERELRYAFHHQPSLFPKRRGAFSKVSKFSWNLKLQHPLVFLGE